MASNATCIFFLLLTLSLSFQTHARDSNFFSKVSKKVSHEESISVAPAQAPTLPPSPEPEPQVIEHVYGLYGQEASYTPPTTKVGNEGEQDKFESLSKNNFFNEKQGMSDTRFLENGKYYYDPNQQDNNVKDQSSYFQNNNDSFEEDNNEEEEEEENNAHFNTNSFENENNEVEFDDVENNGNGNENENENVEAEKRGMSDTRFLENGKYYYDVQNDKYGNNHMFNNFNKNNNNMFNNNNKYVAEDVGFHSSNNVEYANTYNGYETQGRGGYNDNNHNEYGYNNNNVKPKKFANVYDSMEEYDREQGYIDGQDNQYVP